MQMVTVDAFANPHSHLREGEVVGPLIKLAIVGGVDVLGPMPNTKDGLTTAQQTRDYIDRAIELVPDGRPMTFIPIMLGTEKTAPDEINRAVDLGINDIKILPLDRTTGSHLLGVRHYHRLLPLIERCGKLKVKTHWHPEYPWMKFMSRDAEFAFQPLYDIFLNETEAIIISEHGTDARCIPFWKEMSTSGRFFVTLAPQHLIANEDLVFGDVRGVCKPPIKTEDDRLHLIQLIVEDHSWVMAGADDAPHPIGSKHMHQGKCSCGVYHSPFLHLIYATALFDLLQTPAGVKVYNNFTSRNCRSLHNLPMPSFFCRLVRKAFYIPPNYQIGTWIVEPFMAGRTLNWSRQE